MLAQPFLQEQAPDVAVGAIPRTAAPRHP
jgi:hypothetical protein